MEILGNLGLIIGGGFDTTTALTAHALEWLSENPDERELLSRERGTLLDPATEEFLRYFTPAPGTGARSPRTPRSRAPGSRRASDCGSRGRWPTATRRCSTNPNEVIMDRKGNRHFSFGIGVHRCVGSNVARTVFKAMLTRGARPHARLPRATPRAPSTTRSIARHPGHEAPARDVHTRCKRLGPGSTRRSSGCSRSATSRNSHDRSPSARKLRSSTTIAAEPQPNPPAGWFHMQSVVTGEVGLRWTKGQP